MNPDTESGVDINVVVEVKDNASHGVNQHFCAPLPIFLQFEDVRYEVVSAKPKTNWWRIGKAQLDVDAPSKKEILRGISCSVAPGEVLAVMGPSGCGKTSLLNVLSGRMSGEHVTGSILYTGLPYSKSLKRRIGFVTQDDVLFPHLTVRETLMYAALLRLPNSLSKLQKIERSEEIIVKLGLERCRDTMIGDSFLGGISGGERKRVCIGHEILIDPSLLFLDEPTSGLDSTIALRIVQLILSIAQGGRTVVASIHQPSSRLFYMFHKLLLLSEGQTVYCGKAAEAMDYFSSIGLSPALAMNPADFLLDISNGILDGISIPPALETQKARSEAEPLNNMATEAKPSEEQVQQYLFEKFDSQSSNVETKKLQESAPINDDLKGEILQNRKWSTNWWQQFYVLLIRGLNERRHVYLSWMRILEITASSIIAGLLWWRSKLNNENELRDQVGLIFFMSSFWATLPMYSSLLTFPMEREILAKERASDMYRLSAYFLSRSLGDVPMDVLIILIFMILVYFMTNLRMSVAAFLLTSLTIILDAAASQGLGLLIGAAVMDVEKAATLSSIIILILFLVGGYFVQHIPVFISWLKYLSFNYHCFKLLLKVQYNVDQRYDNCSNPKACNIATSPALEDVKLGGGGTEAWAMLLMVVGFRVLGYIALQRMKTTR